MTQLEDLARGVIVEGIRPSGPVTIVDIKWHGSSAVEVTYKDVAGQLFSDLLYRNRESTLRILPSSYHWSFDGDGDLFRLTMEAYRISLAYLFDPLLAVHSSRVEPLPHQITAVYDEMLRRQPLRFLLADDPGAGKTIMAGLFIKELLVRGDVRRCMIVCPGNLVEQWQDELRDRFQLGFEILTNDKLESARTGNWFQENHLVICRLDKLSRNEDVQEKLAQTEWDLIVCDEAHKLSATYFGNEVKYTRRYHLAEKLSELARHFLLMTATPHNGKEEDFQLFLALLDADRFEGKPRDGAQPIDASDMMRRLTKEQLLTFDSKPLFPERIAYTIAYSLSESEMSLYQAVTDYVRHEFDRADALGKGGRRSTIGFALTSLQRRLASSPEAISQSLRRRRERLEHRLQEEQRARHGGHVQLDLLSNMTLLDEDTIDELDDAPDAEFEQLEEQVIDQASAARTVAELETEIGQLKQLEALALQVRSSRSDRKWEELSGILQNDQAMFDANGSRRKLVVFTEHRDTLNYLTERIRGLLGRQEAVVVIHGALNRGERAKAQSDFENDPNVLVLVATDAASEGINLHRRAHLMVNYDLPWNPNRLEQRFGRIHRIGQTEVCHLWNMVARETREGEVYHRLLEKINSERIALKDRVFDVLGKLIFDDRPLRELLLDAVRYGDQPEVRARLGQVIESALDREQLLKLLEERALTHDSLDTSKVLHIREEMERAEARRLQPHFVAAFFREAFTRLGGTMHQRESNRYSITNVPRRIQERARLLSTYKALSERYERVVFEKDLVTVEGKPPAELVAPGHPLLDTVIDLTLAQNRPLLQQGSLLIDPADPGETPRLLLAIEHTINDARTTAQGQRNVASRQVQFVEIDEQGETRRAGFAPHLDYRSPTQDEDALLTGLRQADWVRTGVEERGLSYAIEQLVPAHLAEVQTRREALIERTKRAVHERLTKEVMYWDRRAEELAAQEREGKKPNKLNADLARRRAEDLATRLHRRMVELEDERHLSPSPPVIVGGTLVVPGGLLARLLGTRLDEVEAIARETRRIEMAAMAAVMEVERRLGFEPRDVSSEKVGYDIESRGASEDRLRFIEVKGRIQGATTVTITKNEILTAFNKPDDWLLALVSVPPADFGQADAFQTGIAEQRAIYMTLNGCEVCYVRRPFVREPDFGAVSVNYEWDDLWTKGFSPS